MNNPIQAERDALKQAHEQGDAIERALLVSGEMLVMLPNDDCRIAAATALLGAAVIALRQFAGDEFACMALAQSLYRAENEPPQFLLKRSVH